MKHIRNTSRGMIPPAFSTALFAFCFCFVPVNLHAVPNQIEASRAGESQQVAYHLLTRKNPTWEMRQTIEKYNITSFVESFFNASRPTKIYAAGWGADPRDTERTSDAYFRSEQDINFIAVDWLEFFNNTDYLNTTQNVGLDLAAFIDWLVLENGVPIGSFHLIGHSAGAHLVGAAGMAVTSGNISRITGLDPTDGEEWYLNKTETRLDVTDADFVDIMHTNGGVVADGDLAFLAAIGHVDFYVNGGQLQPGCAPVEFDCCSHCRSLAYFDESIVTDVGFVALRCDTYEEYLSGACNGNDMKLMGEYTPTTARGVYYVDTNPVPPYAMGFTIV